MKRHSPESERSLERRYVLKPGAESLLADNPTWRKIWKRLLSPRPESDERINARPDRYADANSNDR